MRLMVGHFSTKATIIRRHILDTFGGLACSIFSPPGCPIMPPGSPLCSLNRACQDDLGSTLQSRCWAFWGRENDGSTAEIFLLAEFLTGCREVHQILHCLCHYQTDHQEARPIYPTVYPQSTLGIHLHGLHVRPSFY